MLVSLARTAHADEPTSAAPAGDATASGVVDGRLASLDDGIGDRFAAWASERLFAGSVPGLWSGHTGPAGDALLLETDVGARFGLSSDARVVVLWGVAFSHSHVLGDFTNASGEIVTYDARVDRVEAQNPTFSVEWAPRIGRTRFSFGLGAALPTAGAENSALTLDQMAAWDASITTHVLMLGAAGGLAPWRYRTERFALFVPLAFVFPLDAITIALEAAGAISVPVIGAGSCAPVAGDLSADVQLAGDVLPELRLGARFGVSVLAMRMERVACGGADARTQFTADVQPSVTGFARARLGPAFGALSILADLGGPYGVGGALGLWSITLGAGASL